MPRPPLPRLPLRTARLTLEPVGSRHVPAILAAVVASRDHLLPWMPWAVAPTLAGIAATVRENERDWEEAREYHFAMVESGAVIGIAGVNLSWGVFGEIHYWVRADRAGLGFASEAAREIVRLAFEDLQLIRLELRAGVDNHRSQRVAEKLGFVREGVLRNGMTGSDGPFDAVVFGLVPEDWQRLSSSVHVARGDSRERRGDQP